MKSPKTRALAALLAAFAALNVAAFGHARSMTHFAGVGVSPRTRDVARLSPWRKLSVVLTGVPLRHRENRRTPADAGLAFETVTFPGAGGLPVEAWLVPSSKHAGLVLLFHGYGDSKSSVLPAAEEFHRLGY